MNLLICYLIETTDPLGVRQNLPGSAHCPLCNKEKVVVEYRRYTTLIKEAGKYLNIEMQDKFAVEIFGTESAELSLLHRSGSLVRCSANLGLLFR